VQLLRKDKESAPAQTQGKPETKQSNPQPAAMAKANPNPQVDEAKKPESVKAPPTEAPTPPQTAPSDTPAK
jgi:hypothetical protein